MKGKTEELVSERCTVKKTHPAVASLIEGAKGQGIQPVSSSWEEGKKRILARSLQKEHRAAKIFIFSQRDFEL